VCGAGVVERQGGSDRGPDGTRHEARGELVEVSSLDVYEHEGGLHAEALRLLGRRWRDRGDERAAGLHAATELLEIVGDIPRIRSRTDDGDLPHDRDRRPADAR
jgi:hypothetical protein